MIRLQKRRIFKVQYNDITMESVCRFYQCRDNRYVIMVIYDGEEYYTHIEYMEFMPFYNEKDLYFYLNNSINKKCVDNSKSSLKYVKKILDKGYGYVFIKNSIKEEDGTAKFYTDRVNDDKVYIENLFYLKDKLKEKFINTYFVRIPQASDMSLEEKTKHLEWIFSGIMTGLNWSKARERITRKYLKCFTDCEYEDAKIKAVNRTGCYSYEDDRWGVRKIYLIGPCIVGGWEAFEGDALCDTLHGYLEKEGLNYKIINITVAHSYNSNIRKILEYDINKNDIVIFIDEFDKDMRDIDLDLGDVFFNYNENKWLYADRPIHTTRKGNELISNEIVEKIIKPIANISEIKYDLKKLHIGKKQLTPAENIEIQEYLDDLKGYKSESDGIVGACVMTCNPFTNGHYYLVEYASKQVDTLYVFVVEEDTFYFSFEDRIEMVRRGTKNFSNVIVIPGGEYIISKATFKNYFEKERNQNCTIDAEKDIIIFKKSVAPILGICKRFVGEEPDDKITNQYNQLLKRELSDIIEVIEIPRKRMGGGVISASKVRCSLEANNWMEVEKLTPQSTYEYLESNIERIKERKNDISLWNRAIYFILNHEKIVLCGLGKDTEDLMKYIKINLNAKDIAKIEFYDKKAGEVDYTYNGKKVISFEKLIDEYNGYYMLVSSRRFKREIFYTLLNAGINSKHIFVI